MSALYSIPCRLVVKSEPGYSPGSWPRVLNAQTGLGAFAKEDFTWSTVIFYLKNTGLPINFGLTLLLGIIVGVAIAGRTFYSF